MAYDEAVRNVTLNADASLAGYTGVPGTPGAAQPNYGIAAYRFVKVTGARTCGKATAVADKPKIVGVNQSKPQVVGEACTVSIRGMSLVLCGGAFVAGDSITTDSQGRAIKATVEADSLGIAIENASGANTLSTVLLRTT